MGWLEGNRTIGRASDPRELREALEEDVSVRVEDRATLKEKKKEREKERERKKEEVRERERG